MEAAERTGEELPERECAGEGRGRARLLKGEELDTVSRETEVPAHELERWRRIFVEGGINGFKRRDTPGAERELKRVQAKVGELTDEARDRGVVPGKKRLRGGVAEVEALRRAVSPGTHQRYTVTLICEALNAPRASVYAAAVVVAPADGGKRGPKTALTDDALVVEIRAVLAACPFHSEGHRKVHARLRAKVIRVGRKRVLRLMRAHHLLAPSRPRHEHGDPAHAGTIVTLRPDEMWGTDATRFYTERDGWCWFFGAVDHYTTEVMGWHVAKIGDRWAALEPIRQGMTTSFGSIAPKVALGVALRHDWGSQYTANTFVNEIKCWGFTDTPAFVGEPECNGCAERFMRTLKEQCLYLHQFRDLEEARQVIGAFIERYNTEWIVERLGYRTPAQARRDALQEAA